MYSVFQIGRGYKIVSMGTLRNDEEKKEYMKELVDTYTLYEIKDGAILLNDGSIHDGEEIRFLTKEYYFFIMHGTHSSNIVPIYQGYPNV